MSDDIFFDTSFLIGIFYSDDQLHEAAKQLGSQLKKHTYRRIISNYVIDEVLTVLRIRAKHEVVIKAAEVLFSSAVGVVQQTPAHDEFTRDLFLKHSKEKLSFTDASIIALMQYEHITSLATFDKNLAQVAKKYGLTVLS